MTSPNLTAKIFIMKIFFRFSISENIFLNRQLRRTKYQALGKPFFIFKIDLHIYF